MLSKSLLEDMLWDAYGMVVNPSESESFASESADKLWRCVKTRVLMESEIMKINVFLKSFCLGTKGVSIYCMYTDRITVAYSPDFPSVIIGFINPTAPPNAGMGMLRELGWVEHMEYDQYVSVVKEGIPFNYPRYVDMDFGFMFVNVMREDLYPLIQACIFDGKVYMMPKKKPVEYLPILLNQDFRKTCRVLHNLPKTYNPRLAYINKVFPELNNAYLWGTREILKMRIHLYTQLHDATSNLLTRDFIKICQKFRAYHFALEYHKHPEKRNQNLAISPMDIRNTFKDIYNVRACIARLKEIDIKTYIYLAVETKLFNPIDLDSIGSYEQIIREKEKKQREEYVHKYGTAEPRWHKDLSTFEIEHSLMMPEDEGLCESIRTVLSQACDHDDDDGVLRYINNPDYYYGF